MKVLAAQPCLSDNETIRCLDLPLVSRGTLQWGI